MTGAGHQAVVIFFVLSGYLITSSIVRSERKGKRSWAVYLEHRFARLWTVLIPALLLVVVVDNIGLHIVKSAPLYYGAHASHAIEDVALQLTPTAFFGNAFFLQGILTPTFGSDGPFWSLSYEFWYYILFRLGLTVLLARTKVTHRVGSAVLAIVVLYFVGRDIAILFPVWLMGSLLNYLPKAPRKPLLLVLLFMLYIPLLFARIQQHAILFDYALGIATTLYIWLILALDEGQPKTSWSRASRSLAAFSYTLYVIHAPLIDLAAGLWIGVDLQQISPTFIVKAFLLLIAAAVIAYGIASITEFRTDVVRRWLSQQRQRVVFEAA